MRLPAWWRDEGGDSYDRVCVRCAGALQETPQPPAPWRSRVTTLATSVLVVGAIVLAAVPTHDVTIDPTALAWPAHASRAEMGAISHAPPHVRGVAQRRHATVKPTAARTMDTAMASVSGAARAPRAAAPALMVVSFPRTHPGEAP
jgi:hypothetical protein